MNSIIRNTAAIAAATLLLAGNLPVIADGPANPAAAGHLQITEIWARPTATIAATGAGFLRIRNNGDRDERLLGASSPRATQVEMHQMLVQDGVAGMRPLSNGLVIPAHGEVRLAPSGSHLMLIDLQAPLLPGERVPLPLNFEHAGAVPVLLHVETAAPETPAKPAAPGGKADGGEHAHH